VAVEHGCHRHALQPYDVVLKPATVRRFDVNE
jgi:hypothetical protein